MQPGDHGRKIEAESGAAAVETFTPPLDASAIRQKPEAPFRESARAVDLTAADIIVSVGRGIKEQGNIPVVEELAKALGAELAASRPICDAIGDPSLSTTVLVAATPTSVSARLVESIAARASSRAKAWIRIT